MLSSAADAALARACHISSAAQDRRDVENVLSRGPFTQCCTGLVLDGERPRLRFGGGAPAVCPYVTQLACFTPENPVPMLGS